jgi:hypothetical protein
LSWLEIGLFTVLAQSEYKKRHDIFAKNIHMNLTVKFNLLKDTQLHYIYKPESCLENDNYKIYFDRRVLTDIYIQHNRPDIIILNKQQKQAFLLDIAVPNSHNTGWSNTYHFCDYTFNNCPKILKLGRHNLQLIFYD